MCPFFGERSEEAYGIKFPPSHILFSIADAVTDVAVTSIPILFFFSPDQRKSTGVFRFFGMCSTIVYKYRISYYMVFWRRCYTVCIILAWHAQNTKYKQNIRTFCEWLYSNVYRIYMVYLCSVCSLCSTICTIIFFFIFFSFLFISSDDWLH